MMRSIPIAVRAFPDREQIHLGSNRFKAQDPEEMHIPTGSWVSPGIILLNREGEMLHQNREARAIMEALSEKHRGIVFELYLAFKQGDGLLRERVCRHNDTVYLFRPILLQSRDASGVTQLLILIDPVFQAPDLALPEPPIKLTPREKRVVRLLSQGMTNKEVANCMDIGEYTVKGHIKQIMRKFRVTTRAAIVAKSFSNQRSLELEDDVMSARAV